MKKGIMPAKLSFRSVKEVLKDTFGGFSEHKVTKLSGSLAYSTVFSIGPLLIVIIYLCSIFFQREAVEGSLYGMLKDYTGQDSATQLQDIIKNASLGGKGHIAIIIGIITLFIGATAVFSEIQDSINTIWGLKAKPKRGLIKLLQNRLLSFSVIASLGFLLLVSLVVTGIIETLNVTLQKKFPDIAIVVFYVFTLILNLFISTLIFAVIFRVLPDARIKWKDVFAGALITAILFLLGKFGMSFYISKAKVSSTYGAAGSLVVLLLWVYYSSVILYIGAEFTRAYAVKFGSAIYPNEYAVTTKQVEVEIGQKTLQETAAVQIKK
jgi:membrane protein